MLKFLASVVYDEKGNILHKGDRVLAPVPVSEDFSNDISGLTLTDTSVESEVYDTLPGNRILVINPETHMVTLVEAGNVRKMEKLVPTVQHFEGDQIGRMNEDDEMGRARLMSPNDDIINQTADVLLDLMKDKGVRKAIIPLAYNIKKIESVVTAKSGAVQDGRVEAEIYVGDFTQKRKAKLCFELLVRNGKVEKPFGFKTSTGRQYPINEAGIRKFLNIPIVPYFGKRSPEATLSFRID